MIKLSLAKEREVVAASTRHGRRKSGKMIAEGIRSLETMFAQGVVPEFLIVSPSLLTSEGKRFLESSIPSGISVFECEERRFRKLTDTAHSQGFLAILNSDFLNISENILKTARFGVYVDGINDPGNLGTIIRSAAAFGVDFIASSPDTSDFDNPKVVRAAAGLIFSLPLQKTEDPETFFQRLKSNNMEVIGSDANAEAKLESVRFDGKVCLAIGSEAKGLSESVKENCRQLFCINMRRSVESLNAAIAGAIAMHHIALRLELL